MAPSAKMYLPATTPQPQQIAHPIHHQHPKQEQLPTRSANHAPPSDRGIYTCEPTPSVPSLTWRAAQRWRSSSAPSAREPPLRARPTSSGPRRSSWRCGRAAPQAARRRPPPFRPGPGWRCEKKKKNENTGATGKNGSMLAGVRFARIVITCPAPSVCELVTEIGNRSRERNARSSLS